MYNMRKVMSKTLIISNLILQSPKSTNHLIKRCYSIEVPDTHAWNLSNEGNDISCMGSYTQGSGLVLGVYPDEHGSNTVCLTKTATVFNHNIHNKLVEALKVAPLPKVGEVRVYPKLDPTFDLIVVAGLGNNKSGYVKHEARDEGKENVRKAAGAAIKTLQNLRVNKIYVEGFDDPESAAEGAHLAVWENQNLRPNERREVKMPDLILYGDCDMKKWRVGLEKAEAQNFARSLTEMPANMMTPRTFAYSIVQALGKTSVNVTLRGERWLRDHNMNAFLENAKGSPQTPILVELSYNGCDPATPPIVLVGKGITFNAGGLCLKKPCEELYLMRGDMAAAASIVATFKALANLGLPINVVGLLPMGENMPGGTAGKPRDIVKSASGKSILVSPKDFNGNLMLADSICYAQKMRPKYIVSVATLTKEMKAALNLSASGLFTNNEKLWQLFKTAAIHSGDRLWKCPLFDVYGREIKDFRSADLSTLQIKHYPRGISCTSAAFLNQFNCHSNWAHIDMMGTMYEDGTTPYLKKGMSGRPTRTLIEFLGQIAFPPSKDMKIKESSLPTSCSPNST